MAGSHLTGPIVSEQGFKVGTKSTNTEVISSAGAVAAATTITSGTTITAGSSITATTSVAAGTYVSGTILANLTTAVFASTDVDANVPASSAKITLSSTIAGSYKIWATTSTGSFVLTAHTT